jgi:hypothetical protein
VPATAVVQTVVLVETTVIPLAPAALILSLSALALHPVALITGSIACDELAPNIRTTPDLRAVIEPLLARSPTLRAQCARIAATPRTYVTLELSVGPFANQARARATARRYQSGLLFVDIEMPPASQEFAELLAHELEHVIEFIDGVDFATLAKTRNGGIVPCGLAGVRIGAGPSGRPRAAAAEIESWWHAARYSTTQPGEGRTAAGRPLALTAVASGSRANGATSTERPCSPERTLEPCRTLQE